MRAFMLQSENVTGNVVLQYNQQGQLISINTEDCSLTLAQLRSFLKVVPLTIADLESGNGLSKTTKIIEQGITVSFDAFWNKYNKKINRKRSEELWLRMSQSDQVLAYYGIAPYDKYLKATKYRSKADPDTYLRNRYYENEYNESTT